MRILIVDDDPLAGEMAAAVLDAEGHDCVLCRKRRRGHGARWR